MKIVVSENYEEMSKKAGEFFINFMKEKPQAKLGLATGSTPLGLYKELIKANQEGEITFSFAKSVNLDEYIGINPNNEQSYRYFMNQNLFNHINIDKKNTYLPKADQKDEKYLEDYNKLLDDMGTRDIQVLGLGKNGHLAFNEPSDKLNKRTSIIELTESTIQANSRFFDSKEEVPRYAISMGMEDIFNSSTLIVLASGKDKREVVRRIREEKEIYPDFPASYLSLHPNVYLFVDKEAYGEE